MAADEQRAERLRHLKNERPGMTWGQLADYVGRKERSVLNWAKTGSMEYENARKVAQFFEVDLDWFWRGPKEETPDLMEIVAREDQVDGVRDEFLEHVLEMKNDLRNLNAELSAQRADWNDAIEAIKDLLKEQSGLLKQFAGHVKRNEELMQADVIAQMVLDVMARTAPSESSTRPGSS